ncbi:hypothetical protein QQP08_005907 [Theobroma cacao]|nr:hypothetical protein QQP08_005907 [Theobroma cacao]
MAFVDNVSLQISWSKVRNVFKDYRRVVDLFIARRLTKSESKGWLLDWKARKRAHGSLIAAQRESNWIANGGRDLRSYKEVVELSGNRRYDTHRLQVETRCEDDDSESDQTDGEKETEFLLSILEGGGRSRSIPPFTRQEVHFTPDHEATEQSLPSSSKLLGGGVGDHGASPPSLRRQQRLMCTPTHT